MYADGGRLGALGSRTFLSLLGLRPRLRGASAVSGSVAVAVALALMFTLALATAARAAAVVGSEMG